MKTRALWKIRVEELGFSVPTLARLKAKKIATFGDIVASEEQVTCSMVVVRGNLHFSLRSLSLNPLMRATLVRAAGGIKTVGQLLNLDPDGEWSPGRERSRVCATVALVDLDYTEKDGQFLSVASFAEFIQRGKPFRTLLEMDKKGELSNKFKVWFNQTIEGRLYTEKGSAPRKFLVKPFEV